MASRIRIASVDDVPPGNSAEFVAGDRIIALFNCDGTFYALDGVCPHAGGPLAEGTLSGTIVTCPWHGWQFDVTTGQHCLSGPIRNASFPVIIDGDDVLVELPD